MTQITKSNSDGIFIDSKTSEITLFQEINNHLEWIGPDEGIYVKDVENLSIEKISKKYNLSASIAKEIKTASKNCVTSGCYRW